MTNSKAIEDLKALKDYLAHECGGSYPICLEYAIEVLKTDIVRCKECKHGTYFEEAEMYICNANDQDLYEAEHFCSYGEREGK